MFDLNAPVEMIKLYSYIEIDFFFSISIGTTTRLLGVGRERTLMNGTADLVHREKYGVKLLTKPANSSRIFLPTAIHYPVGVMETDSGDLLIDPKVEVND